MYSTQRKYVIQKRQNRTIRIKESVLYIVPKKAICLVARDISPKGYFRTIRPQLYGNTVRRWHVTMEGGGGRVEFTQLSTINPKNPTGRRGDDDGDGARRVEIFTAGNRNKFRGRIDAAKLIYIYIYAAQSRQRRDK